ncbi:ankyrin repeat domain-containing protein [Endozoicomonas sp. YOMI1]|uniref:ankyrin repeat domain-containing protein n=1 Tax=Endozoicomonas sp. YOMI1 TaxID=2828739 RepID=UPI002147C238|nr:ankyrin repeat domain-containing protein [Endozoicomonas sp. YOMI1]
MNGVGRNEANLFFECSICSGDDGYYGQLGGRSLVKTSCDARDVFHLECITDWLNSEQQSAMALDQRQCACRQPALPLIRMDGRRPLVDKSPYCETQIFYYCRTGNLPELRALLRQDKTLANRTYHSVTTGHPEHLLAVALKNGHTNVVGLLIGFGADVNAVEHNGETPLQIAARMRRTEDFNMLVRAGADINNVLRTAVQGGDAPLLQYLSSTESGQLALNNALREAAERGQTQRLEILITAGANNLNDALRVATERGQTQCLRSLINLGANDLDGALNIAVLSGYTEGRRVLEQHGANIFTALNTAASESSLEIFKRLYERHFNETNEEGQTPLHIIAAKGHSGCLERMLEISREKVNARNNSGETALHLAACNGHGECLRKLIEKGRI